MRRRQLLTIFAIVLLDLLGFSLVLPLLPFYAERFGASDVTIGLLVAVYPLAQLFAAPLLGRLSDRYGRRPVLLASIFGTAVGFVVLGAAGALWMLFASRIIDGATGGNLSVAQAYIADVTDESNRSKGMGMIGAAFGLGFVLGPATGGLLSRFGYSVPAYAAAALAVVNLVAVAALLPESLPPEARQSGPGRKRAILDVAGLVAATRDERVGPIVWTRLVSGLSFAMFESTFSLWALRALGLGPERIGLILAYVGLLSVLVQGVFMGMLARRFTEPQLMVGAAALAGAALAAWGLTPDVPVLLVVLAPVAVGLGVANTVLASALSKAVYPEDVGRVLGLQTSIMSLTRIPAPLAGALLLDRLGGWGPGIAAGGLLLLATPYAYTRFIAHPAPPLPIRES